MNKPILSNSQEGRMVRTDARGLIILGSGGFAKEVYSYVLSYMNHYTHSYNYLDIRFVDEKAEVDEICGRKVYKSFEDIPKPKVKDGKIQVWQFLIGVEISAYKPYLVKKAKDYGLEPSITLVHPTAICPDGFEVCIGKGGIIGPYSVISHSVKIGDFVVVNPNVTIRYGRKIEDFSTIPGGIYGARIPRDPSER